MKFCTMFLYMANVSRDTLFMIVTQFHAKILINKKVIEKIHKESFFL